MQSGCATALVLNKWDLARGGRRPRARARPGRREAAPAPARAHRERQDRPRRRAACYRGARRSATARAGRIPTPELNRFLAEVVAAASRRPAPGQPPEAALHGADRTAPAALRDPGQLAQPRDARLRVLPREPPARALPPRRRSADHRLRRAAPAALRGRAEEQRRRPARLISFAGPPMRFPDDPQPPPPRRRARGGSDRSSCSSSSSAPAAGAARPLRPPARRKLVPADALVYVHLSTDPDRDAVKRALELADRSRLPRASATRPAAAVRRAPGSRYAARHPAVARRRRRRSRCSTRRPDRGLAGRRWPCSRPQQGRRASCSGGGRAESPELPRHVTSRTYSSAAARSPAATSSSASCAGLRQAHRRRGRARRPRWPTSKRLRGAAGGLPDGRVADAVRLGRRRASPARAAGRRARGGRRAARPARAAGGGDRAHAEGERRAGAWCTASSIPRWPSRRRAARSSSPSSSAACRRTRWPTSASPVWTRRASASSPAGLARRCARAASSRPARAGAARPLAPRGRRPRERSCRLLQGEVALRLTAQRPGARRSP